MTSLNTRLEVAKSVATPLIKLERQLDATIATLTDLLTAAIAGREKARLPLDAGQDGLDRITAALAPLMLARKEVHQAHYSFRGVQDQMGLGVISYGDHGDTPQDFAQTRGEAAPALAIVSAA
jgi:hypothetical protein